MDGHRGHGYVGWNQLACTETLLLVLVTVLWYIGCYLTAPSMPSNRAEAYAGWWGWFDQGHYYKTAMALAQGRVEPSLYWYGYPLLGALFYPLIPRHPFFLPNLAYTVLLVTCFYYACRGYLSRAESWVLLLLGVFLNERLVASVVWPWNTIPFYGTVFLCAYLCVFSTPSLRGIFLCSAAAALSTFARPPDTLFIGLLILSAVTVIEGGRKKVLAVTIFGVACSIPVALQAAANQYLFGSPRSPYLDVVREVGLSVTGFPVRLYQMFLDPSILLQQSALPPGTMMYGVLEHVPVMVVALPGILFLLRRKGAPILGLAAAISGSVALYTAFNSTASPPHFWSYHNYHYIWWITPWFYMFGYLSLRCAWRHMGRWRYLVTLIGPVALLGVVGYEEEVVGAGGSRRGGAVVTLAERWEGGGLVVEIEPEAAARADGVRLFFSRSLPYHLTDPVGHRNVRVRMGAVELRNYRDYHLAQRGRVVNLSLAFSPAGQQPFRKLVIVFGGAGTASVDGVELLKLRFSPGAYWRTVAARHMAGVRRIERGGGCESAGARRVVRGRSHGGRGPYGWGDGVLCRT